MNNKVVTHEAQKVHSNEQIIASTEFGGKATPQFSQTGLSSNISSPLNARRSASSASDVALYWDNSYNGLQCVVDTLGQEAFDNTEPALKIGIASGGAMQKRSPNSYDPSTNPLKSPLRVSTVGLLSLALAMGIGRFAFTPMLPLMIRDGLIANGVGAWLATANYAGYLIGALWVASIRLSPDRQMKLSWVGIAVVTACMALGHSTALWILWRFIAGVMSACALVATSAWVLPQLAQSRRSSLAGVVYAGVGFGIASVGVFCLLATRTGGGARSIWIGLSLLAAILAWSAHRLMPEPGMPEAPQGSEYATTPTRGTALLVLCYGVGGFGYILPATFLPIMARTLIDDPARFGLAWPIFGIAATISTLVIAYGWPRANRLKVWSVCNIAMAIGAALPTLWPSLTAVIVAALLVGGTFLIITMAGLQEARQREPRAPTHLLSRMTAAFALGQIAAPALVAFVPGHAAASALSFCLRLAALCLVGTALILWRMSAAKTSSSKVC